MTTLACKISQKSLMKNFIIQSMERKKIGQIQGRISRRKHVCNPTIQHVIINLHTKYDSSSLQGCREIFDKKVLRNYGRMDGRTDGRTDGRMDALTCLYLCVFSISKNSHLNPFLATLTHFFMCLRNKSHLKYIRDTQTLTP